MSASGGCKRLGPTSTILRCCRVVVVFPAHICVADRLVLFVRCSFFSRRSCLRTAAQKPSGLTLESTDSTSIARAPWKATMPTKSKRFRDLVPLLLGLPSSLSRTVHCCSSVFGVKRRGVSGGWSQPADLMWLTERDFDCFGYHLSVLVWLRLGVASGPDDGLLVVPLTTTMLTVLFLRRRNQYFTVMECSLILGGGYVPSTGYECVRSDHDVSALQSAQLFLLSTSSLACRVRCKASTYIRKTLYKDTSSFEQNIGRERWRLTVHVLPLLA